uniref:Chemokine (C-C motif) ligand 36, duplicate 1 n=1 Tax=Pygocentrus nattereri TaxID=42514 RepID=A0AAR2K8V0_PYGNA
ITSSYFTIITSIYDSLHYFLTVVKPPKECCFSFYPRPIPVTAITEYKEMSHHCTRAGVVFTTKKGHRVCMDPSFWWVKRAMDIIDRRAVES